MTIINESLKNKTVSGMIWSFIERFGYLTIQFVTNLILARLLFPNDFGLIGIILVFINIANIVIDGGFGSALIQKKSPTQEDYSTIFFINITTALLLYFILFLGAKFISVFYNFSELNTLLKVLGIVLIIDSLGVVQNNILIKNLFFKRIAKIKIISVFIAACVAIIFAINGFGIWSLVIQYIINSLIRTLLLWFYTSWKPNFIFCKKSFFELFGYGSKLLLASLISEFYISFQSLLIGKKFSTSDLGYFTQAKQLQQIPVTTLMVVVNQVTFPVFSELQNDNERLISGIRKSLKSLVFINFPLMVLLTVIAKPLFLLLFTEKWIDSVPYFQGLCLGFGMLLIIHNTNINVLKSVGKSNLVLIAEVIKKITGIALILFGSIYGIIGIIIGIAINSIIEFFINGYFVGKVIGYGIRMQLKDILPNLLLSLVIGFLVVITVNIIQIENSIILILAQSLLYVCLYLTMSKILKYEAVEIYFSIIKNKLLRH